jgi:hypothetical protein
MNNFKEKLKNFGGDYMNMLAFLGFNEKPKPEEIPYLGCYIKSISQLGVVVLQFNITLIPELIYIDDLKRVLRFTIIPEDDGSDDMEGPNDRYNF